MILQEKNYIVERIIGNIILLEQDDCSHFTVLRSAFRTAVQVGDVVEWVEGGYVVNSLKTMYRKQQMIKRTHELRHEDEEDS